MKKNIIEYQKSNYKNCYNGTSYLMIEDFNKDIETTMIYKIPTTLNDELKSTNNIESTGHIGMSTKYIEITTDYKKITNNGESTIKNVVISSITYKITLKENKTEFIQNIINNLMNDIDFDEIESGEDKTIKEENLVFIFTSTENQKINEDKNNVTMNLGECENIIKKEYNISQNNSLYILQVIYEEEGMKIPKIEYEVYYPLYNINNLTKLDLSVCQGSKVEISLAVKINDDLDKYNSSSDYYNDVCYKTTSESGTDLSLKDRKNEFIDNNMTLCEENCELVGYNQEKGKAICSCDIKVSIPDNYEIKFDKKDYLKSFIDIKNFANISILKCYNTVFKIKNLIKNYGFFIISFILILYFITLFIFRFKSFRKLKKDITRIINYKNIETEKKEETKYEIKEERTIKKTDKKKNKNKKRKRHAKNSGIKNEIKNESNIIDLKNKKNKRKKGNKEKGKKYSNQETKNYEDKSINTMNKKNSLGFVNNKNNKYTKELMGQKDFEMNSLDYEEALRLDHRNFLEYYISLLKNNHPLFFLLLLIKIIIQE